MNKIRNCNWPVVPPIKLRIGPKLGTVSATKTMEAITKVRTTIRCQQKSVKKYLNIFKWLFLPTMWNIEEMFAFLVERIDDNCEGQNAMKGDEQIGKLNEWKCGEYLFENGENLLNYARLNGGNDGIMEGIAVDKITQIGDRDIHWGHNYIMEEKVNWINKRPGEMEQLSFLFHSFGSSTMKQLIRRWYAIRKHYNSSKKLLILCAK